MSSSAPGSGAASARRVAARPPLAGFVLIAGLVLITISTLVGFSLLVTLQDQQLRDRVHADNTDAADAFTQLTTGAAVAPAAIAGLFTSVGPDRVTDDMYVEFTRPLLDAQAVNALEWIPVVADADAAAYAAQRAAVYSGYSIRMFNGDGTFRPAAGAEAYYPVSYVEPLEPNRKALGVDLGSEGTRNAALITARDTGDAAATAPIKLAQGGTGLLVFYPAYATGAVHDDVATRREALLGFGLTVLRPAILLQRAATGSQFEHLDIALYDLGATSSPVTLPGTLIAAVGPASAAATPEPVIGGLGVDEVSFTFAGRRLALVAAPTAGYSAPGLGNAWLVMAAGLTAVVLLIVNALIRRRADLRLLAANERLHGVVEASPDAFLGLDSSGVVVDCTPQAELLFGRVEAAIIGRRIEDLLVFHALDEDLDEDDEVAGTARSPWLPSERTGHIVHHEATVRRADHEPIPVEVTLAAGGPADEWPVACFVRDVTELVRAREERARSGRLEALGQLAAGVSHDFRNTLWGIDMVVGSLRHDKSPESVDRDASLIADAVARGNELAAQLLEFARTKPPTGGPISVAATVRELAPMLSHLLGQHRSLALEISVDDDDAMAVIERGQLQTALINLVANARDAMPDGGSVRITCERVELDVTDADDLEITPGDYVMLRVTDTGTGMAPSVARHIFEPYFTTKEVGKGTGLGLATAYGTVRSANGAITVETEPGAGTTFRILLPVDEPFDPSAR